MAGATFHDEVSLFISTSFRESVAISTDGKDFTSLLLPHAAELANRISRGVRLDMVQYLQEKIGGLPLGIRSKLISGLTSLYAARVASSLDEKPSESATASVSEEEMTERIRRSDIKGTAVSVH